MIFTFYSYKGGVGRSMALAGVAHLLAQRGLRTLAIDFDLEAPGLERYFFDGERVKSVRAQRGLLDLIVAYRRALSSPPSIRVARTSRNLGSKRAMTPSIARPIASRCWAVMALNEVRSGRP